MVETVLKDKKIHKPDVWSISFWSKSGPRYEFRMSLKTLSTIVLEFNDLEFSDLVIEYIFIAMDVIC